MQRTEVATATDRVWAAARGDGSTASSSRPACTFKRGIAFVSLAEGIDATTPAGRLQMHILGAIAECERGRIVERVMARLQRARGKAPALGDHEYIPPRQRPQAAPCARQRSRGSFQKTTAAEWISEGTCAFPAKEVSG
jgi:hypothetical protein